MPSHQDTRDKIRKEVLELQFEWERAMADIMAGRQYDELSPEEQEQWKRVGNCFNERIDKKLDDLDRIQSTSG
jgi:hypothetical protein